VFHTLFSPVSIILQLQDTLFSHFESWLNEARTHRARSTQKSTFSTYKKRK
jgi:hypothetical protein